MTSTPNRADASPSLDQRRRRRFRPIVALLAGFLVVSAAMELLLLALDVTTPRIDSAIWIRCSLVLASSVILLLVAIAAARGSRPAWIRLRIISLIVVVAIVVIVSIPGLLPDWVRLEQAVCGALVLPVSILVNLTRTRELFSESSAGTAAAA